MDKSVLLDLYKNTLKAHAQLVALNKNVNFAD